MQFPIQFGNEIRIVSKISTFSAQHRAIIEQASYQDRHLVLPDLRWRSVFLGAGEEKAVFCVCDHEQHVFALEVINERTYLNGRFVGGDYFCDLRVPGLANRKLNPDAFAGLMFTGKVRVREFVYGYEWARFQFDPRRSSWIDNILTLWLQTVFAAQFQRYHAHYQDVHDRNVMFELRHTSASGFPVLVRDCSGRFIVYRVGIQPIDVR
ncbi:MAG: hypothetical protein JXA10_16130 [Anaerolineae bacterium]|nr:hypothetical protein [Anaerolineae bacterium]